MRPLNATGVAVMEDMAATVAMAVVTTAPASVFIIAVAIGVTETSMDCRVDIIKAVQGTTDKAPVTATTITTMRLPVTVMETDTPAAVGGSAFGSDTLGRNRFE